jgi:hypothetical protein
VLVATRLRDLEGLVQGARVVAVATLEGVVDDAQAADATQAEESNHRERMRLRAG